MKNFTAIYDTKSIKNLEYNFNAIDLDHAKDYSKNKFDHKNISNFRIIEEKL